MWDVPTPERSRGARGATLRLGGERRDVDTERARDARPDEDSRSDLAALDAREMVGREIRVLGELRLGHAARESLATNRFADERNELLAIVDLNPASASGLRAHASEPSPTPRQKPMSLAT